MWLDAKAGFSKGQERRGALKNPMNKGSSDSIKGYSVKAKMIFAF